MEKEKPPVRILACGKCYRRDTADATHFSMFHQVEGLLVDEEVTFGDLKGVLKVFAERMFGPDAEMRFRPDLSRIAYRATKRERSWKRKYP